MATAIQHSFAGGQLSPTLWNRVDHEKYASGLKKNRNMIVARDGSIMNRAGTGYVATCISPTDNIRLVPFEVSLSQSYVLEFGNQYMHVIKNGSYILSNSFALQSITGTNPATFTINSGSAQGVTSMSVANGVVIQLIPNKTFLSSPAKSLSNNFFILSGVTINTNTTTFNLTYLDGTNVINPAGSYMASDLNVGIVLSVVTPYLQADLPFLKFDQSVDVMTLTLNNPSGNSYAVQKLTFFSETSWAFSQETFWPNQVPASSFLQGTAGNAGSINYYYKVSTTNLKTGEESFPGGVLNGSGSFTTIYSFTSENDFRAKVTANAVGSNVFNYNIPGHGLSNGDTIQISGYVSAGDGPIFEEQNSGPPIVTLFSINKNYTVTVIDVNNFSLIGNAAHSANYIVSAFGLPWPSILKVVSSTAQTITAMTTGPTNNNPIKVTTGAAHGFITGDQVIFRGTSVFGLDNNVFIVTKIDNTNVFLNGTNGINYSAWVAGGFICRTYLTIACSAPTNANPNALTWGIDSVQPSTTTNPIQFNIYLSIAGGPWGFIGISNTNSFNDVGFSPDTAFEPISYNPVLIGGSNNPACSIYYQQRHCFSNTSNNPNELWASQTGFFNNFTSHSPVNDSDAVIFQLVSEKIDPIINMLNIGNLILFTQNNEYAVLGNNTAGQFGALTPTAINAEVQSFHGCANLRPVRVDGSAIYLQSRGNVLRDLNYFFEQDKYKGNDLTVFSKNLFDNYITVDMDFSEIPNHNLFCVRNDGQLLCLTYVKEQNILAWGTWDSPNGSWNNVCVIPENGYDVAYFVVSRLVVDDTGLPHTYKYIERLQTRTAEISNQSLMTFMDSTGTYNGNNTGSTTMTLSGGNTWGTFETLTLTSSASYFSSAMVGQQIQIKDASGNLIRFTINGYTSATVVTGTVDAPVPTDLQSSATTNWALALNTLTGLWWLNGLEVAVLGDGYVVASPYNSTYKPLTVTNGTLTLPNAYAVISVGIPYLSDVKTLDMDVVGYSVFMGKTAVDKWKNISEITAQVVNTRGGFYGSADPQFDPANTTGDYLFKLFEMAPSSITDTFNTCPPLITDNVRMPIEGGWDIHGNVFIRQPDPLPICLSSVAYSGNLPLRDNEAPPQGGLPR